MSTCPRAVIACTSVLALLAAWIPVRLSAIEAEQLRRIAEADIASELPGERGWRLVRGSPVETSDRRDHRVKIYRHGGVRIHAVDPDLLAALEAARPSEGEDDPHAWLLYIRMAELLGKTVAARQAVEELLAVAPDHRRALCHRAALGTDRDREAWAADMRRLDARDLDRAGHLLAQGTLRGAFGSTSEVVRSLAWLFPRLDPEVIAAADPEWVFALFDLGLAGGVEFDDGYLPELYDRQTPRPATAELAAKAATIRAAHDELCSTLLRHPAWGPEAFARWAHLHPEDPDLLRRAEDVLTRPDPRPARRTLPVVWDDPLARVVPVDLVGPAARFALGVDPGVAVPDHPLVAKLEGRDPATAARLRGLLGLRSCPEGDFAERAGAAEALPAVDIARVWRRRGLAVDPVPILLTRDPAELRADPSWLIHLGLGTAARGGWTAVRERFERLAERLGDGTPAERDAFDRILTATVPTPELSCAALSVLDGRRDLTEHWRELEERIVALLRSCLPRRGPPDTERLDRLLASSPWGGDDAAVGMVASGRGSLAFRLTEWVSRLEPAALEGLNAHADRRWPRAFALHLALAGAAGPRRAAGPILEFLGSHLDEILADEDAIGELDAFCRRYLGAGFALPEGLSPAARDFAAAIRQVSLDKAARDIQGFLAADAWSRLAHHPRRLRLMLLATPERAEELFDHLEHLIYSTIDRAGWYKTGLDLGKPSISEMRNVLHALLEDEDPAVRRLATARLRERDASRYLPPGLGREFGSRRPPRAYAEGETRDADQLIAHWRRELDRTPPGDAAVYLAPWTKEVYFLLARTATDVPRLLARVERDRARHPELAATVTLACRLVLARRLCGERGGDEAIRAAQDAARPWARDAIAESDCAPGWRAGAGFHLLRWEHLLSERAARRIELMDDSSRRATLACWLEVMEDPRPRRLSSDAVSLVIAEAEHLRSLEDWPDLRRRIQGLPAAHHPWSDMSHEQDLVRLGTDDPPESEAELAERLGISRERAKILKLMDLSPELLERAEALGRIGLDSFILKHAPPGFADAYQEAFAAMQEGDPAPLRRLLEKHCAPGGLRKVPYMPVMRMYAKVLAHADTDPAAWTEGQWAAILVLGRDLMTRYAVPAGLGTAQGVLCAHLVGDDLPAFTAAFAGLEIPEQRRRGYFRAKHLVRSLRPLIAAGRPLADRQLHVLERLGTWSHFWDGTVARDGFWRRCAEARLIAAGDIPVLAASVAAAASADDAASRADLADACRVLGDADAARTWYDRALDIAPDHERSEAWRKHRDALREGEGDADRQ